jgi:hypothetical protein
MFWRNTREAISRFHPLHQGLVWEHTMSAVLSPADWAALLESLAQHGTVVQRRKWALPPRVIAVLVPLIRIFTEDVTPGGTLAITADLRGPDAPGKAGPRRQLPVRRPVRSATEWFVSDPWLRLRAELRDGSVLELAVTDRIRHRTIVKVNPRGKRKTKSKTKTVRQISATRTLRRGQAVARPAGAPPPWIHVRVRNGKRVIVRADAKFEPVPDEAAATRRILTLATELFRWTPPRARRSAGRTA